MDSYFEKPRFITNGVSYPFASHTQECYGKERMVGAHHHEHIELLYALDGAFEIFLDGRMQQFKKGDLVIINAMEVHAMTSTSPYKNAYLVIRFHPEMLQTSIQTVYETKYVLPFTLNSSKHQKIFTEKEIKYTILPHLLMEIKEEDKTKEYGFELAIRNHLGRLFLWILRYWHEAGKTLDISTEINQENIQRLESVFDYIGKNYSEKISVQDMASLCNMSYSYFSRFFKQTMNQNFNDYLTHYRIHKSELLLASTDDSITLIAMKTGFSTASYYINKFKQVKNTTPKRYRSHFLGSSIYDES